MKVYWYWSQLLKFWYCENIAHDTKLSIMLCSMIQKLRLPSPPLITRFGSSGKLNCTISVSNGVPYSPLEIFFNSFNYLSTYYFNYGYICMVNIIMINMINIIILEFITELMVFFCLWVYFFLKGWSYNLLRDVISNFQELLFASGWFL